MNILIYFRILFFSAIIYLVDSSLKIGTSPILLSLSSIFGIFTAKFLKTKKFSFRGVLTLSILLLVVSRFFFSLTSELYAEETGIFKLFSLIQHFELSVYLILFSFISTWLVLYSFHWITVETITLILTTIALHADHRDLHLEFPKFIQTLSWRIGSNVLSTFVIITTLISTIYFAYFYIARQSQIKATKKNLSPLHLKRVQKTTSIQKALILLTPILLILFGSIITYRSFSSLTQAGGLLSNGVGQEQSPGNSPLGFHSALGGSNEPAALVRLEGDYQSNPYSPMLYIRESALSLMGKNELLLAEEGFDTDLPRTTPVERYTHQEETELTNRQQLLQSVYLISPHKTAFGIDYPTSIVPLKNPNPSKFKGAFKVTSFVPQTKAEDLADNLEIGDPNWTKLEWDHYLQIHHDKRYTDLALNLTIDSASSFAKITAITNYLSKNATYTLSPLHEVPADGDPVEPFLFGDMRGYCVHFAHATVYLLRVLGIPARIATGYLTDLSQAKDGHILLRMSDRHAWAEVYIRSLGWVPFDTKPDKVESHADTNVDMNLLEELMGELGPDEEILPKDILKGENNVVPDSPWKAPDTRLLILISGIIIALMGLFKIYLRFSWLLISEPRKLLKATNQSLNSLLLDLGYERDFGKTRKEFAQDLSNKDIITSTALTDLFVPEQYSKKSSLGNIGKPEIIQAFLAEKSRLKHVSLPRRIIAILNPASTLRYGVKLITDLFGSLKSLFLLIIIPSYVILVFSSASAFADITTDFSLPDLSSLIDTDDKNKTAEELVNDANILLLDKRPVDARVKLLAALEKDPNYYKAHAMLGEYYIIQVGHFRLALKYIKRAQELFLQQHGNPPYENEFEARADHSYILYLLTQARLNLDNYQGALEILDEYGSYDYYSSWYPGTRAWVLMKLDRIKEAIQVARTGVLSGADEGRTLNMLGILLSMDGDSENALKIFKQAINYELALGEYGQPATPLNNSGEVYREIFEDDKAENSWRKAIRLPDSCEHVLPTMNLGILLMDQLRDIESEKAFDEFEECIKQFPLRNDEEHKALVNLLRGRALLHFGKPESAIPLFKKALEGTQWFGKIGTNESDLKSGTYISLFQALTAKANHLSATAYSSYIDWANSYKERLELKLESWWTLRRARQILAEDLKDFEDLLVRNTDSLLEYGSLGDIVGTFPPSLLEKKVSFLQKNDVRTEAGHFYKLYLAQSYLFHHNKQKALDIINETLPKLRPRYDDRLYLQGLLLKMEILTDADKEYQLLAEEAYRMSHSALRNYGLKLPVVINTEEISTLGASVKKLLLNTVFIEVLNPESAKHIITCSFINNEYIFEYQLRDSTKSILAKDSILENAVNKLIAVLFVDGQ